jgi:hypothetical protein
LDSEFRLIGVDTGGRGRRCRRCVPDNKCQAEDGRGSADGEFHGVTFLVKWVADATGAANTPGLPTGMAASDAIRAGPSDECLSRGRCRESTRRGRGPVSEGAQTNGPTARYPMEKVGQPGYRSGSRWRVSMWLQAPAGVWSSHLLRRTRNTLTQPQMRRVVVVAAVPDGAKRGQFGRVRRLPHQQLTTSGQAAGQ